MKKDDVDEVKAIITAILFANESKKNVDYGMMAGMQTDIHGTLFNCLQWADEIIKNCKIVDDKQLKPFHKSLKIGDKK